MAAGKYDAGIFDSSFRVVSDLFWLFVSGSEVES
jgi:hypothetical protein